MVKHLKGQNVNLLLDLAGGSSPSVIASSISCDFNCTMNTEDVSAKDDPGSGEWNNPQATYYDWSASNQSYLVDTALLFTLLDKVVNGDATVTVQFQTTNGYAAQCNYRGKAVITSLEVAAAIGEKVKVTISLEGASALAQASPISLTPVSEIAAKIAGKALMVAINKGTAANPSWKTIMCSTSHTLTVNLETDDTRDKDMNDAACYKEVVGRSVTLQAETLVPVTDSAGVTGTSVDYLMQAFLNHTDLNLAFGYYPASIGKAVDEQGSGSDPYSWTGPEATFLSGLFLCTSFTPATGENKQDSTMSAEFASKGMPTVEVPED